MLTIIVIIMMMMMIIIIIVMVIITIIIIIIVVAVVVVIVIIITIIKIMSSSSSNRIERRNSRRIIMSSLRRELSPNTYAHGPGCNHVLITCNTSGAYQVQLAVCHVIRRDSSAIKFGRVEIAETSNQKSSATKLYMY